MWRRAISRFLTLGALLCGALFAQVPVPPSTGHVVDQTRTLTAEQKQAIEQTLSTFEARKGSQLAVYMTGSLDGASIEQAALAVAERAVSLGGAWQAEAKATRDAILIAMRQQGTRRH